MDVLLARRRGLLSAVATCLHLLHNDGVAAVVEAPDSPTAFPSAMLAAFLSDCDFSSSNQQQNSDDNTDRSRQLCPTRAAAPDRAYTMSLAGVPETARVFACVSGRHLHAALERRLTGGGEARLVDATSSSDNESAACVVIDVDGDVVSAIPCLADGSLWRSSTDLTELRLENADVLTLDDVAAISAASSHIRRLAMNAYTFELGTASTDPTALPHELRNLSLESCDPLPSSVLEAICSGSTALRSLELTLHSSVDDEAAGDGGGGSPTKHGGGGGGISGALAIVKRSLESLSVLDHQAGSAEGLVVRPLALGSLTQLRRVELPRGVTPQHVTALALNCRLLSHALIGGQDLTDASVIELLTEGDELRVLIVTAAPAVTRRVSLVRPPGTRCSTLVLSGISWDDRAAKEVAAVDDASMSLVDDEALLAFDDQLRWPRLRRLAIEEAAPGDVPLRWARWLEDRSAHQQFAGVVVKTGPFAVM